MESTHYEKTKYIAKLAYETVNYVTKVPEVHKLGDFLIGNFGFAKKQQDEIIQRLIEHPELLQCTLAKSLKGKVTLKICDSVEEAKQIYANGDHGCWCDYYYVWAISTKQEVVDISKENILVQTDKIITKN